MFFSEVNVENRRGFGFKSSLCMFICVCKVYDKVGNIIKNKFKIVF